jgi:hypothetical protein
MTRSRAVVAAAVATVEADSMAAARASPMFEAALLRAAAWPIAAVPIAVQRIVVLPIVALLGAEGILIAERRSGPQQ